MRKSKGSFFQKLRQRSVRYYRRNGFFKSLLAFSGLMAICASAAVVFFVFVVWSGVFGPLPRKEHLKQIDHPIASEVYSADSVLLGRYYLLDRTPVDPADVPDNLKK